MYKFRSYFNCLCLFLSYMVQLFVRIVECSNYSRHKGWMHDENPQYRCMRHMCDVKPIYAINLNNFIMATIVVSIQISYITYHHIYTIFYMYTVLRLNQSRIFISLKSIGILWSFNNNKCYTRRYAMVKGKTILFLKKPQQMILHKV